MSYVKHNFKNGDILKAEQLNEMDTQIAENETDISSAKEDLSLLSNVVNDGYSAFTPALFTGSFNADGTFRIGIDTTYAVTDYIKVSSGISIGCNMPSWTPANWVTYDKGKNIIKIGKAFPINFENAEYVRVCDYNANSDHSGITVTVTSKIGSYVYNLIECYVTPQMFGAKADGVTDDSAALQSAIDSGKRVILPAGTYAIKSSLKINNSGVVIEGANNRTWGTNTNTSYIVTTGWLQSAIELTDNAKNTILRNISIDGNENHTQYGIRFTSSEKDVFCSDLIFENIVINRCANTGILIDSTFKSIFTNVRVSACPYGFSISGKLGENMTDGTTITMTNCYADDCNIGYTLQRIRYSSLINCAADHIKQAAYRFTTCSGISLLNCGCEACSGTPISFMGSCWSMSIRGFEVIALEPLSHPDLDDAIVSCYGLEATIDGIMVVGEVNRANDLIVKTPSESSIVVIDDSINPEKSAQTSAIVYVLRDIVRIKEALGLMN